MTTKIAKWSGEDEPQSYYHHEDTDTMTDEDRPALRTVLVVVDFFRTEDQIADTESAESADAKHALFMQDFMKREKERHEKEQKFFRDVAAAFANGTLTPEHVCSMIEVLRESKIFPDDILDPEDQAEEKQKGFNEIAGMYADWKITKEEACELFVEWTNEWKSEANRSEANQSEANRSEANRSA